MFHRMLLFCPLKALRYQNWRTFSVVQNCKYCTPKNKHSKEPGMDKPISYTQSEASQWLARHSRMGSNSVDGSLWYEPYVVMGSIAVFMIYFCILREENDIDLEFDKTLYSRVEGLEESQLLLSLKYNESNNLDTTDIITKLKEIEEHKRQTKNR